MSIIIKAVAAVVVIGVIIGGGFSYFKKQQSKLAQIIPQKTTVNILIPENKVLYIEQMTNFAQQGGENPLKTTKFIKKEIEIKPTEDPRKASAQAAAQEISPIGGSMKSSVAYLKIEKEIAYVLLDIDLDGWAGVSVSRAIIHPLVEKTVLQFPEIKQVVFAYAPTISTKDQVIKRAAEAAHALFAKDAKQIAALVHPTKGVRFSLYGQVNETLNKKFTAKQITQYFNTNVKFTWGTLDGSGELMIMPLKNFIDNEFADQEYEHAPEILYDTIVARGNAVNNIKDVYPTAHVVEFYFPGFIEKFVGMDWRSIHIVLEEYQGQWYVVGLVSDRWTI